MNLRKQYDYAPKICPMCLRRVPHAELVDVPIDKYRKRQVCVPCKEKMK